MSENKVLFFKTGSDPYGLKIMELKFCNISLYRNLRVTYDLTAYR